MFPDARLLPWKSVIDNVGLGLKAQWRDAARQALAAVGPGESRREWLPPHFLAGRNNAWRFYKALIHRPVYCYLTNHSVCAFDALTRLADAGFDCVVWQKHGFTVLLVTYDVSEAVANTTARLIEEGKIGLDLTVISPSASIRVGAISGAESAA